MLAWTKALRQAQQDVSLVGLASRLRTPAAWCAFTEHHVFAVWDFMSLLKRLQREVTHLTIPWLPPADARAARFVNEMVLAEECDEDGLGDFADHFSTYRRGMREAGANCAPMDTLLEGLRAGRGWREALAASNAPTVAARFVTHTLRVAEDGLPHEVAASFLFGREALLPTLFAELLTSLAEETPGFQTLHYYFNRHVELDGNEHGPMAERLLLNLCGDCPIKQAEAEVAAGSALQARRQLWQGIGDVVR